MEIIEANSCVIKEVSTKLEKSFLEENHHQGYIESYKRYGLFHEDQLISLMTFGASRFDNSCQWEILRECCKKDVFVEDVFDLLWKHFIEHNRCHSCIRYTLDDKASWVSRYGFKNIQISPCQTSDELNSTFVDSHDQTQNARIDIYFPFGVVYRAIDLTTGQFYIGKSEDKNSWNNGYIGSGTRWLRHCRKYRDSHKFERQVLKDDFETPQELFDYEVKAIKEYGQYIESEDGSWRFENKDILNVSIRPQNTFKPKSRPKKPRDICPECGGKGVHKKSCSQYTDRQRCEFCGSISRHKKSCPKHKKPEPCSECGGLYSHKGSCSQYKKKPCSECGGLGTHYSTCSKHKRQSFHCDICHGSARHKKWCIDFNGSNGLKPEDILHVCIECKAINGEHERDCSHQEISRCPICGHKKRKGHKLCFDCREKDTCIECGQQHGKHLDSCSLKKNPSTCPECSGRSHKHYKACSQYRAFGVCSECGGQSNKHHKNCSKYKPKAPCPECGSTGPSHKKTCSQYTPLESCSECGGIDGKHRKHCSQYKAPSNCCQHCGTPPGGKHKKGCPEFVPVVCPECGGRSNRHYKSCSKYKATPRCSECGNPVNVHKKTCSKRKK